MTNNHDNRRQARTARLGWISLSTIRTPLTAQRELRESRVDHIAAKMDLEQLGAPTVNRRGGSYYVLDGQHRIEALKKWLGEGWEGQQIQCWVYDGLTEEQEAETFLKLNDAAPVPAFAKFRVALTAGRPDETQIEKIVEKVGLRISQDKAEGSLGAVGTLLRVYRRDGQDVLIDTLTIIRDAYGTPGLETQVIDGIALFVARYRDEIDIESVIQRLKTAAGGLAALTNRAQQHKHSTGAPVKVCVAASAVDLYNTRKSGKRLSSYWKKDEST